MKKLLVILILFFVLVFCGLKILVWYQVNTALNGIKQSLVSVAIMDWGWISSEVDGQVVIHDLKVTPFALKDSVLVDRVHLRFAASYELVLASIKANGLVFPENYEIDFIDGHLPLANKTLKALQPNDPRYSEISLFSLYSCGDIRQLTGRELLAMGYDELNFTIHVAYSATDDMVRTRGELDGMFEFDVAAKLSSGPVDVSKGVLAAGLPAIRNVQAELKDTGYFRRLSFLCGRLHGLSQSEYIGAALDEWVARLDDAGIRVGKSVRAVITQYADAGATMSLALAPTTSSMKLFASLFDDEAPAISADTIIGSFPSLGLHLSSGADGAAPMDITFDRDSLGLFVMTAPQLAAYHEAQALAAIVPPPVEVPPGYKLIDFGEVGKYLGQKIRVEILSGKKYEGKLTKVGEFGIEVTEHIEGGSFAYPVVNEDVFQVMVWK